ncbi:MAG TPA: sulfatase-like hydrolase/transferase [Polyangiaceae bacterium]|nr:sulfatase-like hydrolase/transferase [Polyangiaceae bacterium]
MALLPSVVLASAVVTYMAVQRSTYRTLLNLEHNQLTSDEGWLLPLAAIGANLGLLLLAAVIGVVLRLAHVQRWLLGFTLALGSVTYWLLFDLVLYRSIGRHLSATLKFALLPQGRAAAGDLGIWVWSAVLWLVITAILTGGVVYGPRWLLGRTRGHVSDMVSWIIAGAQWLLVAGVYLAGPMLQDNWRHQALRERLHGMFVIDPRAWSPAAKTHGGANETRLQRELIASYRNLFPLLFAAKPSAVEPQAVPAASLPNVILIVTESLRFDVFTPELMPRLVDWANQGTVFEQHSADAPYSETAMFSLVYGRSPLIYHTTLDAKIQPVLFTELRSLGYECAFFTGHPRIWMRREEFLNESTLDRYVHDDTGSWPEWDRKALDAAVGLANAPQRSKPVFALVLLMSTHYEYRYPPEYERHLPVPDSIWPMSQIGALGPAARIPHWNRYKNSVAFVDDVVSDAIARLDPARNVVIFTGDHGESIGEDGRYGHGYSFSEKIMRVPLAIVGGPFGQRRLSEVSSHVDLLPTLLPLLGGRIPQHAHGINLLSPHAAREQSFLAHAAVDRHQADALLIDRGRRLRLQLDLDTPQLTVQGLEDELGRLLPSQTLDNATEQSLIDAFHQQLDRVRQ